MILFALAGQKAVVACNTIRGCTLTSGSHGRSITPLSITAGGHFLEIGMSLKNCRIILVPVDFSRDSLEAVDQSLVLAKSLNVDLLLLHVVHDLCDTPGSYHKTEAGEERVRKMTETAQEMMAEFIAENDLEIRTKRAGAKLSVRIKRGLPTTQIIQLAKHEKAGLIAMGSKGRTGLANLVMGSTAERVVRLASVPVMVVKHN